MKKGIIAAFLAVALGIGASQLLKAKTGDAKSCCPNQGTPQCNPPATCCCAK